MHIQEKKFALKLFYFSILIVITVLSGTIAYHIFEGLSIFDSFYMTVITISTVGYSEIQPLSIKGRIISMLIIFFSITTVAYAIGAILRLFSSGELNNIYKIKRTLKMIKQMKNHYIICGYGRIGQLISDELFKNNVKFVIIDSNPDIPEKFIDKGYIFITGDATHEESLLEAGINNAKGIITVVRSEADNVYIILTAKGINSSIFALARATDESAEKKLKRAGANKVMLPYAIGGQRMAQAIIRPNVVDFIDIATKDNKLDLVMEEIYISDKSILAGKNLIESNLRKDFGIIIIAINKLNLAPVFNPSPSHVIEATDTLIILGKKSEMESVRKSICKQ